MEVESLLRFAMERERAGLAEVERESLFKFKVERLEEEEELVELAIILKSFSLLAASSGYLSKETSVVVGHTW